MNDTKIPLVLIEEKKGSIVSVAQVFLQLLNNLIMMSGTMILDLSEKYAISQRINYTLQHCMKDIEKQVTMEESHGVTMDPI